MRDLEKIKTEEEQVEKKFLKKDKRKKRKMKVSGASVKVLQRIIKKEL